MNMRMNTGMLIRTRTPVRIHESLLAAFSLRYSCMPVFVIRHNLSFPAISGHEKRRSGHIDLNTAAVRILRLLLIYYVIPTIVLLRSVTGSYRGGVTGEEMGRCVHNANDHYCMWDTSPCIIPRPLPLTEPCIMLHCSSHVILSLRDRKIRREQF